MGLFRCEAKTSDGTRCELPAKHGGFIHRCENVIFGDDELIERRCKELGVPKAWEEVLKACLRIGPQGLAILREALDEQVKELAERRRGYQSLAEFSTANERECTMGFLRSGQDGRALCKRCLDAGYSPEWNETRGTTTLAFCSCYAGQRKQDMTRAGGYVKWAKKRSDTPRRSSPKRIGSS